MSNCAINIRLLWWHLQVTFDGEMSITKNSWARTHWVQASLRPIGIYDFQPLRIKRK